MGSNDDKENKADGDKTRSKSRESAMGAVPKTDAAGTANGGSSGSKDTAGQNSSASGTKTPVVTGSGGKRSGSSEGTANKRAPLGRLGGRSPSLDNVMSAGLNNVADQMRLKPAEQGLMGSMVDMVARMERSNQAMMDLMLQQAHSKIPEQGKSVAVSVDKGLDENEPGYSTDEDEFDPEAGIEENLEVDQEDEEDGVLLSSRFAGKKQRFIPEQMQVFIWAQARKTGSDFSSDEWRSVNQASLVKSYNSHPEAVIFNALAADAEVPDLKFKDKKDLEKQMKTVMSACGAAGAAATKVLTQLQDENEKLLETAKDYRNPDINIPDSRSEMADILDAVRSKLMNDLAKTLSDAVKLNAFNSTNSFS